MSSHHVPSADSRDLMNDAKTFSNNLTVDLTDEEIQASWRIIGSVRKRHQDIFRRKFNDPSTFTMGAVEKAISEFEDEIKTELAEKVGVLASVNAVPIFEGKPMVIEWLGVIPGHSLERFGMDHEKKTWEVRRATDQGEAYLGESKG